MSTAFAVIDLGFGDAGKGLLTDYLVREHAARLVVRFNGGAQAGHNVVLADGRQHTFAQLGAGSFVPGVRTHLARSVVAHPTALLVEAEALARVGVDAALTRLSVDPECLVTTPFQQAAGRLRELARGEARHGSCGVGVGETVSDALARPELSVHFAELREPARIRDRLLALQAEKFAEFSELLAGNEGPEVRAELEVFTSPALADRFLAVASAIARQVELIADEDVLGLAGGSPIVCEGAQGVLLDERYGFHPFTTWSRTTFDGARELLARAGFTGELERIGVHRTYTVRHGPGPLPTEDARVTSATREPHNHDGPWQRQVRKGWLDLVLFEYALHACGGIDALALTHVDTLADFAEPLCCEKYAEIDHIPLPTSLSEQAELTTLLARVTPSYCALSPRSSAAELAHLFKGLGAPLRWSSHGPTAEHVTKA